MNRMLPFTTVLVYEFFTAGGFPPGQLPSGLAAEALGMLWALLHDFRRWSGVRTITAVDPRFEERIPGLNRRTLPADEVLLASHAGHRELYHSLLGQCDAVLIIAPETGGTLAQLTMEAESAGLPVLGSSSSAVAVAGDKAVCYELFREAGFPTPRTIVLDLSFADQAAKQVGFPLVFKPVDGVGSEGVYRVDHYSEIPSALERVRPFASGRRIILQPFENGIPVSVSVLMSSDGTCVPLSLNRQLIDSGPHLRYVGSQVPFDHPKGRDAIELACSSVRIIPGLRGYVGVDLVLTEKGAQLIEINPRLTTSYIGLRQVLPLNLAEKIWETCMTNDLPHRIPLNGQVTIRKDDPGSWNLVRN